MDLLSGDPYFLLRNGFLRDFDTLISDQKTDVIVLGGGISGALTSYELIRQGIDCIVLDRRKIGLGSSAASTGLLQYELDVPLYQLEKRIGREKATKAYQLCGDAIMHLQK